MGQVLEDSNVKLRQHTLLQLNTLSSGDLSKACEALEHSLHLADVLNPIFQTVNSRAGSRFVKRFRKVLMSGVLIHEPDGGLAETLADPEIDPEDLDWPDLIEAAITEAYLSQFGGSDNTLLKQALSAFMTENFSPQALAAVLPVISARAEVGWAYSRVLDQVGLEKDSKGWTLGNSMRLAVQPLHLFVSEVVPSAFPEFTFDVGARTQDVIGSTEVSCVLKELRSKGNSYDLLALSPRDFEELSRDVFAEFGFEVELTQRSRDGGCDLVCAKTVGPLGFRVIVECKRYTKPVGVRLVRQFVGSNAQWNADRMVFLATSGFTTDAVKFATSPILREQLLLCTGSDLLDWIRAGQDDKA